MNLKIAIPLADGKLCMHFGHCGQFAVLEVDQASHKIISRTDLVPPPHEPGVLPAWLHEKGVTLVIAGGMGQRAQQIFTGHGITVLVGAPADSPENLVVAYLEGTLDCGDNVCDH